MLPRPQHTLIDCRKGGGGNEAKMAAAGMCFYAPIVAISPARSCDGPTGPEDLSQLNLARELAE